MLKQYIFLKGGKERDGSKPFELSTIVSFNLLFNTLKTIKINITPVPTSD